MGFRACRNDGVPAGLLTRRIYGKEVFIMVNACVWFVALSLGIQFLGGFAETVKEKAKATDYIETLWNALIMLAFGIILRDLM